MIVHQTLMATVAASRDDRGRGPAVVNGTWVDAGAEMEDSASLEAGWQVLRQDGPAPTSAITTELILKVHHAVVGASNSTVGPGGAFRAVPVSVAGKRFPGHADIPAAMAAFVLELAALEESGRSPVELAATAMARLTAIHPFRSVAAVAG